MGIVTRIEFDGLEVRLLDADGRTVAQTPAVSGRPLLQNPGFSKLRGKGPWPEGTVLAYPVAVSYPSNEEGKHSYVGDGKKRISWRTRPWPILASDFATTSN